jgi:hypothetical protein
MAVRAQKLKSFWVLFDFQKLGAAPPPFLRRISMMEMQGGIIGMKTTALTCPSEFLLELCAKNFFLPSPLNFLALGTDIVPSLVSNVRKFFVSFKAEPIALQVHTSAFMAAMLIGDPAAARTSPFQEQAISAEICQALRPTRNFL